jgi:hypothetical protein
VGRSSRGCRSRCCLLKRGRSGAFADPALTALEACHVWLPDAGESVFPVVAGPVESSRIHDQGVLFTAFPSLEHILVDPSGRQHVVLRGNGAALQLVVDGADVTAGPVAITFLVRGVGAIRQASEHLATLRRILSPTSRLAAAPRWTPTTRKLRDAFVALDGRAAGASYYEVAIVLHGVEYVERNWRTGLKRSMRHHLRRGLAFSRGGYRDFLR